MKKIMYKSDYFGCMFSTKRKFNEQLQKILNQYSEKGWLLHSYRDIGSGTICSLVFYKEVEEEK